MLLSRLPRPPRRWQIDSLHQRNMKFDLVFRARVFFTLSVVVVIFVVPPILHVTIDDRPSLSLQLSAIRPSSHPHRALRLVSNTTNRSPSNPSSHCTIPTTLPPLLPSPSHIPKVLRDYLVRHAQIRASLVENPHIMHTANAPRVLVWRCIPAGRRSCGGVGDRMRGIRLSFLLAVLSNRAFFIEWPTKPYPLLAALVPAHLDWTLPTALSSILPHNDAPQDETMHAHIDWYTSFRDQEAPLPSGEKVDLRSDMLYDALVQLPAFTSITSLSPVSKFVAVVENPNIPEDLLPRGPLPTWARGKAAMVVTRWLGSLLFTAGAETRRRVEMRGLGKRYVAIHLRTGVDMGEQGESRFSKLVQTPIDKVTLALLRCARRTAKEGMKVYALATDSQRHAAKFASAARANGVKVSVPEKAVMHVSRGRNERGRECEMFMDVFTDLMMLADGEVLVSTKSGFSDAAFFMGRAERWVLFNGGDEDGGRCFAG